MAQLTRADKQAFASELATFIIKKIPELRDTIIEDKKDALVGAFLINPTKNPDIIDYIIDKLISKDSPEDISDLFNIPSAYRNLFPYETLVKMQEHSNDDKNHTYILDTIIQQKKNGLTRQASLEQEEQKH